MVLERRGKRSGRQVCRCREGCRSGRGEALVPVPLLNRHRLRPSTVALRPISFASHSRIAPGSPAFLQDTGPRLSRQFAPTGRSRPRAPPRFEARRRRRRVGGSRRDRVVVAVELRRAERVEVHREALLPRLLGAGVDVLRHVAARALGKGAAEPVARRSDRPRGRRPSRRRSAPPATLRSSAPRSSNPTGAARRARKVEASARAQKTAPTAWRSSAALSRPGASSQRTLTSIDDRRKHRQAPSPRRGSAAKGRASA